MISAQKPEYTHDWLEEAAGNWNRPNNPGHTSFKPDSSRGKLSKEQRRKIIEAHNSGRSTGAQLAKEYGRVPRHSFAPHCSTPLKYEFHPLHRKKNRTRRLACYHSAIDPSS